MSLFLEYWPETVALTGLRIEPTYQNFKPLIKSEAVLVTVMG